MLILFLKGVGIYLSLLLLFMGVEYVLREFKLLPEPLTKKPHYFIITKNNQINIEWYISSICFKHWIKGEHYTLSIIDLGSNDDTLSIIEHLSYSRTKIEGLTTHKQFCTKEIIEEKIEKMLQGIEQPIVIDLTS